MKRTKDKGAIINGQRITLEEFEKIRAIRDFIRVWIIIISCILTIILNLNIGYVLGITFILFGWRLRTGW